MIPTRRNNNNWLPSIFNDFFDNELTYSQSPKIPSMNIIENQDNYEMEIAAPGMTKEDFNLSLNHDGDLVIKMEKHSEEQKKDKEGHYIRKEFSYSGFQKTMILPDNVDKDKISAKMNNGVLYVEIPKLKECQKEDNVRLIDIK